MTAHEGTALFRRTDRRITWSLTVAHTLGAIDVFVLLAWLLPPPGQASSHLLSSLVAVGIYLPVAGTAVFVLGRRHAMRTLGWLIAGREPTKEERNRVLQLPMHCTALDGAGWFGALILFTALAATESADHAFHVATTIAMGALTVCAVAYLLVERILRPVTALALDGGAPSRPVGPGVHGRLVLAWLCASGVPIIGIVMVACHALFEGGMTMERLAVSVLFLGCIAAGVGLAATIATAKSVADPVTAVRRALARVEAGDLAAHVRIDDASEIGLMQAGFNRMAAGLRDRERLRDLFGRHVGEDVAQAALAADPALGGEQREVAALFVDLVGSTALAASRPPDEVVETLNRFFGVVVETVDRHGGWVNKFEGDAAMCVFGAPVLQGDPSACALAAARELDERLCDELPFLSAGIGVSSGIAVAGWVGAERRLEYTVIGDPVNEAARLCELAKRTGRRVLASESIVARAEDAERSRWRLGEDAQLRGRLGPTRLASPA